VHARDVEVDELIELVLPRRSGDARDPTRNTVKTGEMNTEVERNNERLDTRHALSDEEKAAHRQRFSIDLQSSSERRPRCCTLERSNQDKREETCVDHGAKLAECMALFIALNVRAIYQVE